MRRYRSASAQQCRFHQVACSLRPPARRKACLPLRWAQSPPAVGTVSNVRGGHVRATSPLEMM